jgi:hypothetical protein
MNDGQLILNSSQLFSNPDFGHRAKETAFFIKISRIPLQHILVSSNLLVFHCFTGLRENHRIIIAHGNKVDNSVLAENRADTLLMNS